MNRMQPRKAIGLFLIAASLLTTTGPLAATAGASCTVLTDGREDVGIGKAVTNGLASPVFGSAVNRTDILRMRMAASTDVLTVAMDVVDLSGRSVPGSDGDEYWVWWMSGPTQVDVHAYRLVDGWSFRARRVGTALMDNADLGARWPAISIEGGVDTASDTVVMQVPLSLAFHPADPTALGIMGFAHQTAGEPVWGLEDSALGHRSGTAATLVYDSVGEDGSEWRTRTYDPSAPCPA